MSSPTLTVFANDILNKAYSLLNVKDAAQAISSNQSVNGLRTLNMVIKSWQSQGLHLWTKTQGILFLEVGKGNYELGPLCDPACKLDDLIQKTVTVGTAGSAVVVLNSTGGLSGSSLEMASLLPFDPSQFDEGQWFLFGATNFSIEEGVKMTFSSFSFLSYVRTTLDFVFEIGVQYTFEVDTTFVDNVGSFEIHIQDSDNDDLAVFVNLQEGVNSVVYTTTETELKLRIQLLGDVDNFATLDVTRIEVLGPTGNSILGSTIGIELDDGTRQFSTVDTVDSNIQVTLVDTLTDDSAEDNTVVAFDDLIERPLNILDLRRTDLTGQSEIESNKWSRQQYFAQTNKETQGVPTNWYYSPQLNCGRLYLWQTPNSINNVVKFTYIRPLQTVDNVASVIDFPSEWAYVLILGLAVAMAPSNQYPSRRLAILKSMLDENLEKLLGHDRENSSLNIQPNNRG